jgi:hypothetical protein
MAFNPDFVKKVLMLLLPFVLIFAFIHAEQTIPTSSDYVFHYSYKGDGTYPPFLSWCLDFLDDFMPRDLAMILFSFVFVVFLPFALITHITKNLDAGFVYLYGSMIPMVLGFVWLIPQAIIHVFILATYAWFPLGILFAFLGGLIHKEFWAAILLTAAFIITLKKVKT